MKSHLTRKEDFSAQVLEAKDNCLIISDTICITQSLTIMKLKLKQPTMLEAFGVKKPALDLKINKLRNIQRMENEVKLQRKKYVLKKKAKI